MRIVPHNMNIKYNSGSVLKGTTSQEIQHTLDKTTHTNIHIEHHSSLGQK